MLIKSILSENFTFLLCDLFFSAEEYVIFWFEVSMLVSSVSKYIYMRLNDCFGGFISSYVI